MAFIRPSTRSSRFPPCRRSPTPSSSTAIRGLIINRFILASTDDTQGNGIFLEAAGGNTIEGNFLGTDPTGTLSRPNQNAGIFVSSLGNAVGGNTSAARNVISGNAPFDGV